MTTSSSISVNADRGDPESPDCSGEIRLRMAMHPARMRAERPIMARYRLCKKRQQTSTRPNQRSSILHTVFCQLRSPNAHRREKQGNRGNLVHLAENVSASSGCFRRPWAETPRFQEQSLRNQRFQIRFRRHSRRTVFVAARRKQVPPPPSNFCVRPGFHHIRAISEEAQRRADR